MSELNSIVKSDKITDELQKCETEIANLVEEFDNIEQSNKEENVINVNGTTPTSDVVVTRSKDFEVKNESASEFQRLSRRESSLENLADIDDEVNIKIDKVEEKAANDTEINILSTHGDNAIPCAKSDIRSQNSLKRSFTSLFSCCTVNKHKKPDSLCNSTKKSKSKPINCLRGIFLPHDSPSSGGHNRNSKRRQKNPGNYHDYYSSNMSTASGGGRYRDSESCATNTNGGGHGGNLGGAGNDHTKCGGDVLGENGGHNIIKPVLLGPLKPNDSEKKCLIIDLDETLVHSSFKMVEKADFRVGVEIDGTCHTVYVLKRPHVDLFLQKMGRLFECVLFTASLAKYADPVADFLDKWQVFRWRLFREACVFHRGNYVKDLDMIGRSIGSIAILDNSPASYLFHPAHAIQITSWFDDPRDTALLELIPYLEQLAASNPHDSVPVFLANNPPPAKATVPVNIIFQPQPLPTQQASSAQAIASQANNPPVNTHNIITSVVSSTPPLPTPTVAVVTSSPLGNSGQSKSLTHLASVIQHQSSTETCKSSQQQQQITQYRKQTSHSQQLTSSYHQQATSINPLTLLKQWLRSKHTQKSLLHLRENRSQSLNPLNTTSTIFSHQQKTIILQRNNSTNSLPVVQFTQLLPNQNSSPLLLCPPVLTTSQHTSAPQQQQTTTQQSTSSHKQLTIDYLKQPPRSVSLCLLESMEDIPSETAQSSNINYQSHNLPSLRHHRHSNSNNNNSNNKSSPMYSSAGRILQSNQLTSSARDSLSSFHDD